MEALAVPVVSGPIDVVAAVPGSKSVTNRALVCAALATGCSDLGRCAPGDDTNAMIDGLRSLGIEIERAAPPDDHRAHVEGAGGVIEGGARVHAGLAGTTSRFLTAVCALSQEASVVDGDPALEARPMAPLHDALVQLGATVRHLGRPGYLPVEVSGPPVGGEVELRGDVSSQFLTALMLIAPLLERGVDIELTTPLVSRPYVELTASVMRTFGIDDVEVGVDRVVIRPGRYVSSDLMIEPDASSASYPLALAAIAGGTARVGGLADSHQGDVRFVDLLERMGCTVARDGNDVVVTRSRGVVLRGIDVDMADISDLVPTMAVVAATAATPTTITGVGFVRNKESDRLGDLAHELAACGVEITVDDDGLTVRPPAALLPGRLATHHDHRLAMSFGVLGVITPGTEVLDPGVVSKSWPGFWDELRRWVGGR